MQYSKCVWLKVRKSFSAFNRESEEGSRNTLAMVQRLLAQILEAGSKKTKFMLLMLMRITHMTKEK